MRLNFSGVNEDEIREGIRRIGKVVAEQVALYGTLTGAKPAPKRAQRRRRRVPPPGGLVKVAVLKGGASLERTVSLRSGARVEDALARLGHEVCPIDVGARPRRPPDRRAPRRRVRRAARPRRRGRHRPGAARARRRALHRVAPGRLHPLHGQGRRQARAARRRHPDARLLRVLADRLRGARRRPRAAGDRGAAGLPDRRQARRPGLRARDQVRPHRRGRPERAGRRVLLRHEGPARALHPGPRPRGLGARLGRRAGGAARRRGDPDAGGLLRLRGALRDRPHALRLPGRPVAGAHRRGRRSSRWRPGRRSAAPGSPASI